ncbi:hypothetical protein DPMN_071742 [Dreissena polymorpha]|uniref:Uncharacterized protein n=1 Tax=Dreissena polymorpha TaxID=45954 RepID=A0A9D3Z8B3_DREPO|nr:hypothetical protein DPMN_071742 [Dreissena polymorpha]
MQGLHEDILSRATNNSVVPILRRVMALSSTMLAEYLSGGLRVFAGLVKVCRQEAKLSVRRFH